MECLDKAFSRVRGFYLVIGEVLNLSGFVWVIWEYRGHSWGWVVTACQCMASLLP